MNIPCILHQSEKILIRKLDKDSKCFFRVDIMNLNPHVDENIKRDLLVFGEGSQIQETFPDVFRQELGTNCHPIKQLAFMRLANRFPS